jgi:arylsulfatase A-like enzyme
MASPGVPLLVGTLLAAILGACQGLGPGPQKPPIILIIIDTLRADHVGACGYTRPTTPNLDRFAASAVRFANAQAASTWTVPSMASLFTGVYPWRHGINTAEVSPDRGVGGQPVLSDRFVTLAESLKAAGYETFGVSANGHMDRPYGMAQGFDHFQAFPFCIRERVDRVLAAWLRDLRRVYRARKPYFLYVHYFDPHHPYLAQQRWLKQWRPGLKEQDVKEITQTAFATLAVDGYFQKNPEAMKLLIDLYDSEVAAVDASVGKLLSVLPGAERAVVVVTADHGEEFGDHGGMLHGNNLFAETLRVPLVIRWPANEGAGAVVTAPVSLVDLYPTLAAAGGAALPDCLDGVALKPDLTGDARALFAATERDPKQRWSAAVADGWKWVCEERAGEEQLFRLASDPGDQRNLLAAEPDRGTALRRLWNDRPRQELLYPPGDTGAPIDPARREQLRGLGYLP